MPLPDRIGYADLYEVAPTSAIDRSGVRPLNEWMEILNGVHAGYLSVQISDTPPASPFDGSFWWQSSSGRLFVRYNDGNSTQWCETVGRIAGDISAGLVTATGGETKTLADWMAVVANTIDVKAFGAIGDGVTNDLAAIQAAIDAAAAQGGAVVAVPPGTYLISASLVLKTGVFIVGQGRGISIIKLAASANTHVVKTLNFETLVDTNTPAGEYKCGLRSLTIDGNAANQSVADPALACGVAVYGKNMLFEDLFLRDIEGHAVYSDGYVVSETRTDSHVITWQDIHIYNCGGDGLHLTGPSDCFYSNIEICDAGQKADNTYHGVYCGTSVGGCIGSGRFVHIHPYHFGSITNRMKYAFRSDITGYEIVNSHLEGGRAQVYMGGGEGQISNSLIYGPFSNNPQIVVDGAQHRLDARFLSMSTTPSPVVLQIGNGTLTFGYDIDLSVQVIDSAPKNELVRFNASNDLGGLLKIYSVGCGAAALYTGTKYTFTEGFIRQTAPVRFLHRFGAVETIQLKLVTANTTVVIPSGMAIRNIFIENIVGSAVTGGLKIGTTDGGTQVVAARAVAGSTYSRKVPDTELLLNKFGTVPTTLYIQAVTSWNSASLNIQFDLVQTL